jgi:hypothetical protein
MSAAAILSVAARKAASEGKKVGAAALTMIALVVMSLTVFPGLNRAPSDQMAEAPANPGSSQEVSDSADTSAQDAAAGSNSTDAGSGDSAPAGDSDEAVVDGSDAGGADSSPAPVKVKKNPVEKVLDGPALSDIMNADSRSMVFVLDQNYTAIGDNGLTARFTFNPTSETAFTGVLVEVQLEDLIFDFRPAEPIVISGKNEEGLQAFVFVGKVPTLIDESGKKWSETVAKGATFVIEVTMERNGTTVKEITLAMYRANS